MFDASNLNLKNLLSNINVFTVNRKGPQPQPQQQQQPVYTRTAAAAAAAAAAVYGMQYSP
jgi:hypothetical protein